MTRKITMEWVRANWSLLKSRGTLEEAIQKAQESDAFLKTYSVEEIISIEECFPAHIA